MKATKPAYNSFRKKVVKKGKRDTLRQNIRYGETLIPVGSEDAHIVLPKAKATHTYDILKTEGLDSNLKVSCGDTGVLAGLLFSNTNGTLSIEPILNDTRTMTLNPSLSDGSWMELLSEGSNWFCWGWTGGELLSNNQSPIYIPPNATPNDEDGDGLSNEQENTLGTDPNNADSDNDGSGDGTETGLGTDPTDDTDTPDPNQDSDGDGASDSQEITDGTDPLDPTSFGGGTSGTIPDPSEIGPVFTGIPNNLVIEAGTLEADAKVTALIGVVANDNIDGSVPVAITFTGYTGTHGETFTATYSATDLDANTTEVTKTFSVADTVAPIITLLGDNPLTVTSGSVGADPGATTDDGSPVTSSWDSTITDTTATGSYDVIYTSEDAAGNSSSVTRDVVIEEVPASEFIEESANLITGSLDSLVNDVLITDSNKLTNDITEISRFALEEYIPATSYTATYSIWFKKTGTTLNTSGAAFDLFPIFGHQGNYNYGVGIRINTTNGAIQACANLVNNSGSQFATIAGLGPSGAITDGVWNHLALSISLNGSGNTQVQAVVNGVAGTLFTRTTAVTISAGNTADVTLVGANVIGGSGGNLYAEGEFDSFEIVNGVALTAVQMQAIYSAGRGNMMIGEA